MKKQTTMVSRVKGYLAYRRSLGFTLRSHGYQLLNFARFADLAGRCGAITPKLAMRWIQSTSTSTSYAALKLSAVRSLARYLAIQDGRSQAPDPRLIGGGRRRKRPHIFTASQLQELLDATDRVKFMDDLGPITYRTLFGLLASTGLRISEAVNLRRKHVDLTDGILRIERTKFRKSRLVPLHPTVVGALRDFLKIRDQQWTAHPEQRLFLGAYRQPLSIESAQDRFRQVCELLGWHVGNGEMPRPRLHDLRHTFACHCIQRWYTEGRDVHQHINALSIYMGHVCITSTYWYLTASPELLNVAGHRFERFVSSGERRSS